MLADNLENDPEEQLKLNDPIEEELDYLAFVQ
jgi:hypothetical protein